MTLPLSIRQNLPANVFRHNHLHNICPVRNTSKSKSKGGYKCTNQREHTLDSKFIRIADFVAALARSNCILVTGQSREALAEAY